MGADESNEDDRSEEKMEGSRKKTAALSRRDDSLTGTTRLVYRYIYRHGPVRLPTRYDRLNLKNSSSSSISDYHVQKLLRMKLIREEGGS